jgi:hypothetical protein
MVQNVYQNRRESTRLLFETAYKDYELRILKLPENIAAFPVILDYHELYSKPIPAASGESYDLVKYYDTPLAVLERQRPSRKTPRVQSKGFSGKRENRCATIVPLA